MQILKLLNQRKNFRNDFFLVELKLHTPEKDFVRKNNLNLSKYINLMSKQLIVKFYHHKNKNSFKIKEV